LFVGVGGTDAANAALETVAKLLVIRVGKRSNGADRRGGKFARRNQLPFHGRKQIACSARPRGERLGGGAPGSRVKRFPTFDNRFANGIAADFAQRAKGFNDERLWIFRRE